MEIFSPAGRQLLISGTASIAPGGKTLWQDDVRKQVELTMAVVEAILHSRGFTVADLTRATAYFKDRNDFGVFNAWCRKHGLTSVPVVAAQCTVCRDDLLFELEADAMKSARKQA
jgi:enamine deaminase RidA (YjgF/YER057c/UK114 family)